MKTKKIELDNSNITLLYSKDLKSIQIYQRGQDRIIITEQLKALELANAIYKLATAWINSETKQIEREFEQSNNKNYKLD